VNVREPRHNVVINSSLRHSGAWQDVRILDISSRGLGLHASSPPGCGSYVEVRRGPHIIIARVVWVKGNRFGVFAQDAVPIHSVISKAKSSGGSLGQRTASDAIFERRAGARSRERQHERSRTVARAMEFAFVATLGASAAFLGFDLVKQAVARPLAVVQIALAK